MQYQKIYEGKNGGYVEVSTLADANDYEQNLHAAKILADYGHQIVINRHYKKGDPEYRKNAEYTINGNRSDLKTPTKLNSIGNGFSKAQKQRLNEFVCHLQLNHSYENIIEGLDKGFTYNDEIEKVIFIKKICVEEISRQHWIDLKHFEIIRRLLK